MANQPTTISASETMTTSTMSDSSQSSKNPSIEAAESWNNRLFGLYAAFLVVTGILAIWFTVAVFKAGNKVQEAIKADADSRIETLRTEGDKARAELAITNARISDAEARVAEANRGIEEARRATANALKEVAEAKERTGILELEAATQRGRAAGAERELIELNEQKKGRRITTAQRTRILQALTQSPKGSVQIDVTLGDGEARSFAGEIREILEASGWLGIHISQSMRAGTPPIGVSMVVRDANKVPLFVEAIRQAFESSGIAVHGAHNPDLPEETLEIIVGSKP